MPDIPFGFSFEETDDGYILRHKTGEIRMAPEEFHQLRTTIELWKDRRLSRYREAAGGEVRPIVVHPVARAVVWPDAIGANILLNVVAPSGHHMTLSLRPDVAADMARALPDVLAMITNPRKQ